MHPERLSLELRTSSDPDLERRRKVAILALGASASMAVISLFQLGITRGIPEPNFPLLDAEKVDSAEQAYAKLQMPDGPLGLVSYAATLALAAAGGPERWKTHPVIPLALAAKATVDAAQAARLTYDQWAKHRAFCSWCLGAAAATFVTLPLTIPEARKAWKELRS